MNKLFRNNIVLNYLKYNRITNIKNSSFNNSINNVFISSIEKRYFSSSPYITDDPSVIKKLQTIKPDQPMDEEVVKIHTELLKPNKSELTPIQRYKHSLLLFSIEQQSNRTSHTYKNLEKIWDLLDYNNLEEKDKVHIIHYIVLRFKIAYQSKRLLPKAHETIKSYIKYIKEAEESKVHEFHPITLLAYLIASHLGMWNEMVYLKSIFHPDQLDCLENMKHNFETNFNYDAIDKIIFNKDPLFSFKDPQLFDITKPSQPLNESKFTNFIVYDVIEEGTKDYSVKTIGEIDNSLSNAIIDRVHTQNKEFEKKGRADKDGYIRIYGNSHITFLGTVVAWDIHHIIYGGIISQDKNRVQLACDFPDQLHCKDIKVHHQYDYTISHPVPKDETYLLLEGTEKIIEIFLNKNNSKKIHEGKYNFETIKQDNIPIINENKVIIKNETVENNQEIITNNDTENITDNDTEIIADNDIKIDTIINNDIETIHSIDSGSSEKNITINETEIITNNDPDATVNIDSDTIINNENETIPSIDSESNEENKTINETEIITNNDPDATVNIDSDTIINNENDTTIKNDPESNTNNVLFNTIWNNVYLRGLIRQHSKLFSMFYECREFDSLEDLLEFEFKEYLYKVKFNFIVDDAEDLETVLPKNIESLVISVKTFLTPIPSWIKKVTIVDDQHFNLGDYETEPLKLKALFSNVLNLETLEFESKIVLDQLSQNAFKNTLPMLKELKFPSTIPVVLSWLPKGLKKLYIHTGEVLKTEILPNSLTELSILTMDSTFPIKDGNELPSGLQELKINRNNGENLSFKTDKCYKISNKFKLPSSLKHLEINTICDSEDPINFPSSLKTIKIQVKDMQSITSLPNALEVLDITSLGETNSNLTSILSKSLKYLTIRNGHFNQKLEPNMFPSSLTSLEFIDIIFDNDGGNPLAEDNLFPSSLTYLNLGDTFNEPIIGLNVLPKSLKTLILGKRYHHRIVDGSIPSNLELLQIKNQNYNKFPIKLPNPNTIVDCCNYYKQYERNFNKLITFKVPKEFRASIDPELFTLKDRHSLEYIDLSENLTPETVFLELPFKNSIKTLVLGDYDYSERINIDKFPYLQTLIVNDGCPLISTKNYHNNNLKTIIVNRKCTNFIDLLDPIFYNIIKLK
ncbi:hypothetical protein DICPUDRAFT_147179 [Dictyostelium purpureum]|uniref:Uncharacterized protein n=1 Tax=Dictyostelium purpureum TaxID=5786 RepID=F0Z7V4_DICPU|nr:uncharacterized protein DICPUDRAFT_147179 [Dictyostelium purpureum]EGC40009.1 hypothetical protein DICPUDRAFT_147179 [Dictyostelium purpureum]|eukprot:XP_003283512.1 hypothetical protein DICPUDRAFT_147179 [Dictyostelium purpureum]